MIAIAHWILKGRLASPVALGLALAFLAGPWLAFALHPMPGERAASELVLAWAHPSALIGTCLGLVSLSRGREFLDRVAPGTRWGGELLAVTAVQALLQLPILGGAWAAGVAAGDLGVALPAILTLDLRLAATALLLLVPPLSAPLCAALFLGVAWLVPALAVGSPALARATAWLDAGAGPLDGQGLRASLACAAALLLPGLLLRLRGAPAGAR